MHAIIKDTVVHVRLNVCFFKGLHYTNLFSSKKGNAHNLVHALCNKTLNFCAILQQCEQRKEIRIKKKFLNSSSKLYNK